MTSEKLSDQSQAAGTSKKCKTCGCVSEYDYHKGCVPRTRRRITVWRTCGEKAVYCVDTGEMLYKDHIIDWEDVLGAIGVELVESPPFVTELPDKLPQ